MRTDAATYDVFVSYSRRADARLAPALQRELERLAKPWYRMRALRVFRDGTGLAADPGLWSAIERALSRSAWLMLLASEEAATSDWVDREVAWWLAERPRERLLIVLTGGAIAWDPLTGDFDWERTTALPPSLRGAFAERPRWVDARAVPDGPGLVDCAAEVAAAVHGVAKDQLVGEHIRQHRRTMRIARSGVAALAVLLVLAVVAGIGVMVQRNEARAQTEIVRAQRQEALSRQLAAEALAARDSNPERAAMIALASWQTAPTVQARGALLSVRTQEYQGRLIGHTGRVWTTAITPDGTMVATGGADHTVRLWDVATHRELARFDTGPGEMGKVAFSPDGTTLAATTYYAEGTDPNVTAGVILWDVRTRRQLWRTVGACWAVRFSPDGRQLAVGCWDGIVRLVDLRTRTERRKLSGHRGYVIAVAYSPDGKRLFSGGDDGLLVEWELTPRQRRRTVIEHRSAVTDVTVSPDGRFLADASGDSTVRLWKLPGITPWRTIELADTPWSVGFAVDGVLAYTTTERRIGLYDAPNGISLPSLHTNVDTVTGLAIDRTGQRLITAGLDGGEGLAYLWEFRRQARGSHLNAVSDVSFDSTGRTLASSGDDRKVRLWTVTTPGPHRVLSGHQGRVTGAAFNPGDTRLASAGLIDGTIRLWNTATWLTTTTLTQSGQPLHAPVFSRDGKLLAAVIGAYRPAAGGRPRPGLGVWDVASHRLLKVLDTGGVPAAKPQFSPGDTWLAAPLILGRGRVRVWRISDLTETTDIAVGDQSAGAIAFRRDGQLAASGESGVVHFFEPHTWGPAGTVSADAAVRELAYSPDGTILAAATQTRTARLWNTADHTVIADLDRHTAPLNAVAFAPDGRTLATGGTDAEVILWNLDPAAAEKHLCAVLAGAPVAVEWERLGPGHGPPPHCAGA